jgi:hypothetical protein
VITYGAIDCLFETLRGIFLGMGMEKHGKSQPQTAMMMQVSSLYV